MSVLENEEVQLQLDDPDVREQRRRSLKLNQKLKRGLSGEFRLVTNTGGVEGVVVESSTTNQQRFD